MNKKVTIEDLIRSFGCDEKDFSNSLINNFNKLNLSYEIIKGEKLQKLYIEIIDKILTDKQVIGSSSRTDVWLRGWSENLDKYTTTKDNLSLIPKFIRPGKPIRFFRKYIKPENEMFELDYFTIYRQWLYEKYFHDYNNIYEFGCGTGFNLLALSNIYPDKKLFGSDFVKSSVDLVNLVEKNNNINLEAEIFDLINPNFDYEIRDNSLICTFGAIEQINSKFDKFIQFVMQKKPSLVIHTEPVIELYDKSNLNDFLAFSFQSKRGYTSNYLPYLEQLNEKGKIDLIKVKRLEFGSTMMEGFNLIIWSPKTS